MAGMEARELSRDVRAWMRANLTTQGYCLTAAQRRELALGRRRHAFKLATVWLPTTAAPLAAGATTAGLALGVLLLMACATVTATNFCLPSKAMALWERHHQLGRLA